MKMIEPEGQLEACCLSAESELAAAEQLARPSRAGSREVKIEFDWQIPVRADSRITFQVRISRQGQHSAIDFAIELGKLVEADLGRLHDLLLARPKGYWLTRELTWLLTVSLRQQEPSWNEEDRHAKVRELLLAGE
jgi:hypothetical protein